MGKLRLGDDTRGLSVRGRIDFMRSRYGLSLGDITRRMGYADRSIVKHARSSGARVSSSFLARLEKLEVDLLNERGLLYQVSGDVRLPKVVYLCVRRGGEYVLLARAVRGVVRDVT